MITNIIRTTIKNTEDVCNFFEHILKKERCSFHPDDSFLDIVDITTGQQIYSKRAAENRDNIMSRCVAICENQGADIYELALNVAAIHYKNTSAQ